jgi:hypothetical protein
LKHKDVWLSVEFRFCINFAFAMLCFALVLVLSGFSQVLFRWERVSVCSSVTAPTRMSSVDIHMDLS